MPPGPGSALPALTALSNLAEVNQRLTESASKLATGQRVVSANDDVVALAVGTRLSHSLSALGAATLNANQATALLQTADTALARIGEQLGRLKALSVQAGSETITDTERALIDVEYQAVLTEIDRIARDTRFGDATLIDADNTPDYSIGETIVAGQAVTRGEGDGGLVNITASGFDARRTDDGGDGDVRMTVLYRRTPGDQLQLSVFARFTDLANGIEIRYFTRLENSADSAGSISFDGTNYTLDGPVRVTADFLSYRRNGVDVAASETGLSQYTINNNRITFLLDETFDLNGSIAAADEFRARFYLNDKDTDRIDRTFRVGTGINPLEDDLSLVIHGASTRNLGIASTGIGTRVRADAANLAIDTAIDTLTSLRATVGSEMRRMENAAKAVAVTLENLDVARSAQLDLDVSREVADFTSQQILRQAGVSILAQTNNFRLLVNRLLLS